MINLPRVVSAVVIADAVRFSLWGDDCPGLLSSQGGAVHI